MASLSPAYFSLYVPTPPVLTLLSSWIFFFSTLLTYFMLYLNKTLTKGKTCSEFIVLSLDTNYLASGSLSCSYHWLAVDMCSYFSSRRQSLETVNGLSCLFSCIYSCPFLSCGQYFQHKFLKLGKIKYLEIFNLCT